MSFTALVLEKKDNKGYIKLNRPHFNALNLELANDLIQALENCCEDENVKVLLITGLNQGFCSGGDLEAALETENSDPSDYWKHLTRRLNRIIVDIRYVRKPVIAAINGPVAGAGMSIMAACDLRIASRSSIFKQAWTSIGLVPDGAWTLFVPLLVGFGRASELAFMDPVLTAEQAQQMGLINVVAEDEAFTEEVERLAESLKAGASEAYARAKELLNDSMLSILEAQLSRERREIVTAALTSDYKEGMHAFLEKRSPKFHGK
ncbi:2-(1,2-epoxy-1,2-dihydrophenyl)acetyl-CoA isomerase [Desulfotomaculum arcticum]|uniref:2-(1,2-epoxy-1,2-dihydrophenyl)acetyl-CoA isomerase n=1 Tax=Desulfotruncus arcticus DSM 17038 TaxID=1121424 RepID=A0A1I2RKE9_9FIRM|nr:enoyl-CoA hydratase-related protein [Desulfotruncus arcticus]SFG40563.1 2-(1,2-epoxy-1,2-dihydrophenyl)acetyl-CoA isomerase [Desulfotomaculum arcticum] [Desulfotruncus arcticus DSM 17038]